MKLRRSLWGWLVLLLVLRLSDLTLTYLYTPDLAHETNPIVGHWELGWTEFLLVQLGLYLCIAFATGFYFATASLPVEQRGLKLYPFIRAYFFNHKAGKVVGHRHRNHARFLAFMIFVASLGISLFAVVNNGMLLGGVGWYTTFLLDHVQWFLPTAFGMVIFCSSFLFFVREHGKYVRG